MLRVVTFKLEEEVLEALDQLVKKLGKSSRSELIKEAIMDLLKKHGIEVEIKPRPRKLPLPKYIRLVMVNASDIQVQ